MLLFLQELRVPFRYATSAFQDAFFFFLLAVTLQLHHHVLCHIVAAIVGLVPHFLRYNLHRICRQFGAKVGMQIIREFQCACWASRH